MLTFCRCQQYPIDVCYHRYRKKWKEMKMIFRLFSYFAWLEWPCVVGRWIRLKIGNNVIDKKYTWFHFKKWSWPWRSFSASLSKRSMRIINSKLFIFLHKFKFHFPLYLYTPVCSYIIAIIELSIVWTEIQYFSLKTLQALNYCLFSWIFCSWNVQFRHIKLFFYLIRYIWIAIKIKGALNCCIYFRETSLLFK